MIFMFSFQCHVLYSGKMAYQKLYQKFDCCDTMKLYFGRKSQEVGTQDIVVAHG